MRSSFVIAAASLFVFCVAGCASEPEAVGSDTAALNETSEIGANTVSRCHGTEPFWGISIAKDKLTFEGVESNTTMLNRGPIPASGFTAEYAALYQGQTIEDPAVTMNVVITRADGEGCSDGMSDELYPFTVSVIRGGQFFSGCCSK